MVVEEVLKVTPDLGTGAVRRCNSPYGDVAAVFAANPAITGSEHGDRQH